MNVQKYTQLKISLCIPLRLHLFLIFPFLCKNPTNHSPKSKIRTQTQKHTNQNTDYILFLFIDDDNNTLPQKLTRTPLMFRCIQNPPNFTFKFKTSTIQTLSISSTVPSTHQIHNQHEPSYKNPSTK